MKYEDLAKFDHNFPNYSREIQEQVEIEIKYEGYIKKQMAQAVQYKWRFFLYLQCCIDSCDQSLCRCFLITRSPIKLTRGTSAMVTGQKAAELIRRPQMKYEDLAKFDHNFPNYSTD